ncbi:hypothetical protein BO221_24855 [Archangium sp. Cb G35]|jgi:DNA-binding NarL/FixJ family response regulator|nr:hypothetical protein BO221_24855 [Archangium sp. Cb G35]
MPPEWQQLLTPREAEIVNCLLRGWDNQLVAEHLGLALATVKKHLQNIFGKLGVDGRVALILQAARNR